MRPFKHYNARSVEEALSLLKRYEGKACLIAGGTDLLGVLKGEILPDYPEALVNIKTILGLNEMGEDEEGLKLGALVRLVEIARFPMIKGRYGALVKAAESVATPEIRNMGTVGGNLCQDNRCWYYRYPHHMGGRILCYRKGEGPCHAIKGDNRYHAVIGGKGCFAVCPSDMAVALAALDGRVRIAQPDGGKKDLSILEFYTARGHVLRSDEILTEIRVPRPPDNARQTFLKFRLRESVDFAVASVASLISVEDGVCKDARIVLGAVAPTPYRAMAAEAVLKGRHLEQRVAEEAAEAALSDAKPLAKNAYKVEVTKTLVKRAILSS
ncbi:MAG: xanthine dehydrogenase family protein subunit M [Deltaproteobacteria bacterium]|nr:xanthine dehydrogenase family protein subunit M [Deltaproteobacteria bacterium]MBW2129535.1 xanthine dehydrogenase family protein subunit M [Deltaproteobacteria bacterium]